MLACETALEWLVPTTVLRQIPIPAGGTVEGSAQVMWPQFNGALQAKVTPADCSDDIAWPIALFDLLVAHNDRKDDNWGVIDALPRAVLIDNGHAFGNPTTNSPFCARFQGQQIPPDYVARLQPFRNGATTSRLWEFLPDAEMRALLARADALLNSGTFA